MALNEMQRRFHELGKKKAELTDAMQPTQAKYDALREQQNVLEAQITAVKEELRTKRAPIYEIDVERASLARALNGQTGRPE